LLPDGYASPWRGPGADLARHDKRLNIFMSVYVFLDNETSPENAGPETAALETWAGLPHLISFITATLQTRRASKKLANQDALKSKNTAAQRN
jgi:hypothetical protein